MSESQLATVESPIVISQYEVLLGDIKEAKNAEVPDFDYASPKGSRDARSFIFNLRKLKGRIESARVDAKAYAVAYGRKVDEQAKSLKGEVDALIEPHQSRLDEIARNEAERVASLKAVHDYAVAQGQVPFGATIFAIQARIVALDLIELDTLQEWREPTAAAIVESRRCLLQALEAAQQAEAARAELERLRQEQERREAEEARAQIEREAQARADAEAQAAAAEAIADAEARAAEAEAQLALQRQPAPAAAATPAAGGVRQPSPSPAAPPAPGAAAAAAASRKRKILIDQLLAAMGAMRREAVANAIADGRLHPALSVDWEAV